MIPLKPRGRFRRPPAVFDQVIYILPKSGIGQYAFDPVARDRLEDDPGIMRDRPKFRVKLSPHFVSGMIPRPVHIQGEFRQRIESFYFRRQEMVNRVDGALVFAHILGVYAVGIQTYLPSRFT